MRRRDVRDEAVRLSELDLVINEPFGWPGPLKLAGDQSTIPAWLGWAFVSAIALYGGIGAAQNRDTGWAIGLVAAAAVAGLVAWRFWAEGVVVDAEAITARDVFANTRVQWSDAADILATGGSSRSATWVETTDGSLVRLPHLAGKGPVIDDAGVRQDLQLLACWWQTGRLRASAS